MIRSLKCKLRNGVKKKLLKLFTFYSNRNNTPLSTSVTVFTTYGPVQGLLQNGDRNTIYYSFRGIPYAKPPLGTLRFKDPQYPDRWTAPFDATKDGPVPYAFNMDRTGIEPTASEDCLRLNVFSKSVLYSQYLTITF